MNDKQRKEIIYNLTQRPEWKAYMDFKKSRLDDCHQELEFATDPQKLQGQIIEIRNDLNLINELRDFLNY